MTADRVCIECGRDAGVRYVRSLCMACYNRARYHRTLDHAPRPYQPAVEVLPEWVLLRDEGVSVRDAAPRLGVTFAALDQALYRARARGDARGRRTAFGRDLTGARS